jgi:acetyltransferase-like isoleucine patch superfamily enzyme
MGFIGKSALNLYSFYIRSADKLFSLSVAGAFAQFGNRSIIQRPVRISGAGRIAVGSKVFIGSGGWMNAIGDPDSSDPAILIGNGTSMSGMCVISAAKMVKIDEFVLMARNVYISDHIHNYQQVGMPVSFQGIGKIQPVVIGRGAWLGQNVVVCPGVTIGQGAVVGANSVVNSDIPEYSLAVGSPARVVKVFSETNRPKP